MFKPILFILFIVWVLGFAVYAQKRLEVDTIKTTLGDLAMTFIGHGTLMFTINDKVIHVDPVTQEADYTRLPKADLILITHEHFDHLDAKAIAQIRTEKTQIVYTENCAKQIAGGTILKNGESKRILDFTIEAVAAYNIQHKRGDGTPFHPRGVGNGYIITCGDKRIYVAGDTENIPEMKNLRQIDIAFLPMNLPYTMTPEMVADAAKAFKPRILYPYHYGNTDTKKLIDLLKAEKDIDVRIRQLQ